MEDITYDHYGRMNYNPELHFAHGKRFTEEEKAYICKFYEFDGAEFVSLALGKTEKTIYQYYSQLKKQGLIEHYKRKWDEQYYSSSR